MSRFSSKSPKTGLKRGPLSFRLVLCMLFGGGRSRGSAMAVGGVIIESDLSKFEKDEHRPMHS